MSAPAPRMPVPRRHTVSLLVLGGLLVLGMALVPAVVLLIFAGLLFGALLDGGARLVAKPTGLKRGAALALFAILLVLGFVLVALFAAPGVADQFRALCEEIPAAVESLRERLEGTSWGADLIDRFDPAGLIAQSRDAAFLAMTSTFGALGNLFVIIIIGIYVAVEPDIYRRGLGALVVPERRPRADEAMSAAASTLRQWLGAQLIAMAVVGGLTWIGLWLIGVPLSFVLGFIAAILAFIPNIGPILSAVPAVLLALAAEPVLALWVVALFVAVQTVESYLITPLVQKEQVDLAPVFTISMQILFGALFGVLGLMLATPIAAVGQRLVRMLYIHDYLERPLEERLPEPDATP